MAIKASPTVGPGVGFDREGATRARTEQGTWIKGFDKHTDRALELMGMTNCKSSTSPKLDKQHMDGDEEDFKDPGVYRSTARTFLYLARRQPETVHGSLVAQAVAEAECAE